MTPIFTLIIGKILDYLADNADEIVEAIKETFFKVKEDPDVIAAMHELGYDPSEKSLQNLCETLKGKGEDTEKLAKLLVNKAQVS